MTTLPFTPAEHACHGRAQAETAALLRAELLPAWCPNCQEPHPDTAPCPDPRCRAHARLTRLLEDCP